ncbi:glycosyltransferase family 2 protein [Romeria aff. gracilis LEGE 07310]|uniref:Glycosyltransferase family 2 protein n=1 Tax=Vasconcelosia minhoensis LEGE 07310 TaxID=915328 RepID=A0A8J7AP60_9CYAN|nr:hormogonium polysaccharide biosynthesis glycosyltransferase HpsE [Romeria gracilis]MBE9078024.1 glycosyltransferase family 2 protein [Romeria aff. gracilis LEGE 07310]
MVDFSVVICTYNGASRLPQVLERLRSQLYTQTFSWEVLIVDNNSQDDTARLVQQYQADWLPAVPLRYVFEPRQGLAYARRLAVQTVVSPLIGFLDDDTWPEDTWVSAAYQFAQQHPQVGAFGSAIRGSYEVLPPPNFQRIACCLAVIQRGAEPFQYSAERGVLPAGAGMVIRRRAWVDCVPEQPSLTGVCGSSLDAKGEDVETLSYLRSGGWPIWHNPHMQLFHRIPKARLERGYLLTLFQRIGYSRYPLRMVRYAAWQRPLMVGLHGANDLRKVILHILHTRQLTDLETTEACERMLLYSSLLSPLYHWQSQIGQGLSWVPLQARLRAKLRSRLGSGLLQRLCS